MVASRSSELDVKKKLVDKWAVKKGIKKYKAYEIAFDFFIQKVIEKENV